MNEQGPKDLPPWLKLAMWAVPMVVAGLLAYGELKGDVRSLDLQLGRIERSDDRQTQALEASGQRLARIEEQITALRDEVRRAIRETRP